MDLTSLGLPKRKSVLILGAGASRGSSFAGIKRVQPPLDADFFVQVRRMGSELSGQDKSLLTFMQREFGVGKPPTLEEFFTQIAAIDRFHTEFHVARGRITQEYQRMLKSLRDLVPRVFKAAFEDAECVWHYRLAAALRPRDTVLSFNYDCLIDSALQAEAKRRWRPGESYGFEVVAGVDLWKHAPAAGKPAANPVILLKPHGSLNWHIDNDAIELTDAYDERSANSIVPPTWDKEEVTKWPWNEVWKAARKSLAEAKLLVVVGYSVPVTDQLSQALIRADVNDLEALVLVNPDAAARTRFRNLVNSALGESTAVLEFETLEDFSKNLELSETERKRNRERLRARDRHANRSAFKVSKEITSALAKQGDKVPRGTRVRIYRAVKESLQPPRSAGEE